MSAIRYLQKLIQKSQQILLAVLIRLRNRFIEKPLI